MDEEEVRIRRERARKILTDGTSSEIFQIDNTDFQTISRGEIFVKLLGRLKKCEEERDELRRISKDLMRKNAGTEEAATRLMDEILPERKSCKDKTCNRKNCPQMPDIIAGNENKKPI